MTERVRNAGVENAPNACESNRCASERHVLASLIATIRSDRASYQSAMPMVIEIVEPMLRPFVARRAARLGFDHAFAEDAIQDALLLVATRAHRCSATTDRAAMKWMHAVARSAIRDALRREGPSRLSLDDTETRVDPPQSFDESVGRRTEGAPGLEILLRLVVDAGVALSADDATLLWMRLIGDEEWTSIGAAFGISATAARRRFQRAQQSMRRRVHRALWTLPPDERDTARAWLKKQLREEGEVPQMVDSPDG